LEIEAPERNRGVQDSIEAGGGDAMSMNWGTIRIILGTLGGGALGFYVMHNVENNYKEKIRADIAKLQQEEGQLGNTKSKELLDAE